MEYELRLFTSYEEAERAEREFYRSLTPDERLMIAFELYDMYYDAASQRLDPVYRITECFER